MSHVKAFGLVFVSVVVSLAIVHFLAPASAKSYLGVA